MFCSLCAIKDSPGYLHTTVYFKVMLETPWHNAKGNKKSKDSYIK